LAAMALSIEKEVIGAVASKLVRAASVYAF
jgi:hypothetical protein